MINRGGYVLTWALLRRPLMSPFRGQSGPSGFFPSVSRDPIRGERPRPAEDGDPLFVSGRASRLRRGRSPARLPLVVPTAFRYRLDHVLGYNPLPSRPRNTDRAGAVEAGDRADQHVQAGIQVRPMRPNRACVAAVYVDASRRKYWLPRLDMPPNRFLPPVEFCRGPDQATLQIPDHCESRSAPRLWRQWQ